MEPEPLHRLIKTLNALAGSAAGLSDEECLQLDRTLHALIDSGVGIFLVDHNMDFIAPLCERMVVLANGKLIADGDRDVLKSPEVISAYLD